MNKIPGVHFFLDILIVYDKSPLPVCNIILSSHPFFGWFNHNGTKKTGTVVAETWCKDTILYIDLYWIADRDFIRGVDTVHKQVKINRINSTPAYVTDRVSQAKVKPKP